MPLHVFALPQRDRRAGISLHQQRARPAILPQLWLGSVSPSAAIGTANAAAEAGRTLRRVTNMQHICEKDKAISEKLKPSLKKL